MTFEYLVIDERGDKFIRRLNELSTEGWIVHSYSIGCSNTGTTRSALLYREVIDLEEDNEELELVEEVVEGKELKSEEEIEETSDLDISQ